MALLIPRGTVAARWQGERESRLNSRPLERFLRARGLKVSTDRSSRSTDNVSLAAFYLVGKGLDAHSRGGASEICPVHFLLVTQAACAVSDGLSSLIKDDESWRTAALVSSTQLLKPYLGLGTAARVASVGTREYAASEHRPGVRRVIQGAAAQAVQSNDDHGLQALAKAISHALTPDPAMRGRDYPLLLAYEDQV